MKTIIAPMPIAAMVSCSCVLLFFMFVFFMVITSDDDVPDVGSFRIGVLRRSDRRRRRSAQGCVRVGRRIAVANVHLHHVGGTGVKEARAPPVHHRCGLSATEIPAAKAVAPAPSSQTTV